MLNPDEETANKLPQVEANLHPARRIQYRNDNPLDRGLFSPTNSPAT